MRKREKSKRIEEPEVPTASLVDIAFLIIIFFIMTTTLTLTRGIVADMPSAQREEAPPGSTKIPIVNLNEGSLSFNDRRLSFEELREELRALQLHRKEGEGKVVMFEASGNVEYQRYFEILSAISASGGVVAFVSE